MFCLWLKGKKYASLDNREYYTKIERYSKLSVEELLNEFNTTEEGLSQEEVERRLRHYGPNKPVKERIKPWYVYLFEAFTTPFSLILYLIIFINLLTDVAFAPASERSYTEAFFITLIVLIGGLVTFLQEYRSDRAVQRLKSIVAISVAVIRKGVGKVEVPVDQIVPGDLVFLSAGDMVPADIRLISAKDLYVDQSLLTGESEPVEKFAQGDDKVTFITDLKNICFAGTSVLSGTGIGVVLLTGENTYLGSIASIIAERRPPTAFDKDIRKIGWFLVRFMLFIAPLVFMINALEKGNWTEALLFSLSVAVGLTPEMLPVVITANLARGAVAMAKKRVIVKRLGSIQDYGSIDVLCTDKTGTLTVGHVVLTLYINIKGDEELKVLKLAYLNSYFQTSLKNHLDIAVLEKAQEEGLRLEDYERLDEIPFDFERRRMSVVVKDSGGKYLIITKGAVEEMLEICAYTDIQGNILQLNSEIIQKVLKLYKDLGKKGLRVLAVGYKEVEEKPAYSVEDEMGLILAGFVCFLDPPKEDAKEAIHRLTSHGVEVKVITGDNELVAKRICRLVGLEVKGVLLGPQIEKMDKEELKNVVENTTIFAKVTPSQKAQIIQALKEMGKKVGFLGDGINDVVALKVSDVGISVMEAVDVAKESADIILLRRSLYVLADGLIEGRKILTNALKYVKMTISSNFGNVISILLASLFIPFLPMRPAQILFLNLLYDLSQITIAWDKVDKEYIKRAIEWDMKDLFRFVIFVGPISSVFDILTFLALWFIYGANEKESLFQTGWFMESLITQMLIVHMIRTPHIPFLQSKPSAVLLYSTFFLTLIGLATALLPFGFLLGFLPPPYHYFLWLLIVAFSYMFLTHAVKRLYIKRFGRWL